MLASLVAPLLAVSLAVATPQQFGAVGDGKHDDRPAIQRALDSLAGGTLSVPAGRYRITRSLRVPAGVSMTMEDDAELVYEPGGGPDAPALVLGRPDGPTMGRRFTNLSIRRSPSGDWKGRDSVGVRAIRLVNCRLEVRQVIGFRIGIEAIGDGGGFAYNEVAPGYLAGNQTALALVARGPDGYCNENVFYAGRFAGVSDRMRGVPRYGVVADAEDGAKSLNNNRFLAPCFELLGDRLAEAVPIVLKGVGSGFAVLAARTEGCGPVFARETGEAKDNRYDVSYADVPQRIERGPKSTSILVNASNDPGVLAATRLVWSAADLGARSRSVQGATEIEGFSFLLADKTAARPRLQSSGRATVGRGGLLLAKGWAIGRIVDTRRTKTLVLDAPFDRSPAGRASVRLFRGERGAFEQGSGRPGGRKRAALVLHGVAGLDDGFGHARTGFRRVRASRRLRMGRREPGRWRVRPPGLSPVHPGRAGARLVGGSRSAALTPGRVRSAFVEGPPVRVGSLRAVFEQLVLPVGLVVRSFVVEGANVRFQTGPIQIELDEPGRVEALIDEADVQKLVQSRAGDQLRDLVVRLLPDRIEATATVQVVFAIRATAVLTLRIADGTKLYVDVQSVNVMGSAGQNLVQRQLDAMNPLLDTTTFPLAVRLEQVEIREGELRLTGSVAP